MAQTNPDHDTLSYLVTIGMDEFCGCRLSEMAKDKAEREKEWLADIMVNERAGLPAEEQANIPKLTAENNLSYAYLRSKGNTWQYDPNEPHPKLKNRLYRRFDTFDKNSDNVMTIKEVLHWAERMKQMCDANEDDIEKVRLALKDFFEACGVTEAGLRRENWVEGNQVFGEAERERMRHGEPTLVARVGNAYYDVLDRDHNSLVSMAELKKMMNVFRVPEEAAYTFFQKADLNGDGKLQRNEMHSLFHKFWLERYNPDLDGIYAYKY